MLAKIKCSNCSAEISNLNISWGKKQIWFMVPIMLIGFYPLAKMTVFKADPLKDLAIAYVEQRSVERSLEFTGIITNSSSRTWSSVTVEVEFFDSTGKFIDEESERIDSDIGPHAKEHFKINISSPSKLMLAAGVKSVVKITGGHTMSFQANDCQV
jgi:hypothetical protein